MHILLLNGPNLNLLGKREPSHYGVTTLTQIEQRVQERAARHNVRVSCFQSNHEGALIDHIQQTDADFILFNPAAFTHTSVALRDALLAVKIPFVEIHLSNVHSREPFRHHSYFSDIAKGVIAGLGAQGYLFALDYALDFLKDQ